MVCVGIGAVVCQGNPHVLLGRRSRERRNQMTASLTWKIGHKPWDEGVSTRAVLGTDPVYRGDSV